MSDGQTDEQTVGRADGQTDGRAASPLGVLRRICGMPDYQAYLAHLHAAHPGCPVPTEREYFDEFVRAKYAGGPTRCC